MGCPAEVVIGDNLVFSICTHDPDTGILTDADSPPAYRVYEDETAAPILTGTMAVLDTVNTTGFYTELIACTTAAGFENGKSYTVYIEATVDGDKGGICYGFKAVAVALSAADIKTAMEASGTLLYDLFHRHAGKVVADRTGNSIKVYDGATLLYTLTKTTVGDVDTYTRS